MHLLKIVNFRVVDLEVFGGSLETSPSPILMRKMWNCLVMHLKRWWKLVFLWTKQKKQGTY